MSSIEQVLSFSNWICLALGLGLGVGGNLLVGRWGRVADSTPAPQDANQDLPIILEQLKQTQVAYQLAQQMSQFKAGFLTRVSHELRSPLNSMIGLHQLILSDLCDDSAEEREFVAQAHKSALKLVKLLDEILDVARTEHGTNQLELQPLQLTNVLEEVYQLTHLLAANRNLRMQLLAPDPDICVLADPRWLRQVLVSFIDTSIAQMQEGRICISAQTAPTSKSVHIWLDVELSATSWSEAVDLMQFADTFSKSINDKPAPSPGLTLLLSQKLLELMKGHLEVLPVLTDADLPDLTRIQIAIPLVIPEAALLEQEGNRSEADCAAPL